MAVIFVVVSFCFRRGAKTARKLQSHDFCWKRKVQCYLYHRYNTCISLEEMIFSKPQRRTLKQLLT